MLCKPCNIVLTEKEFSILKLRKKLSFFNEDKIHFATLAVCLFEEDEPKLEFIDIFHEKEKLQMQAYGFKRRRSSYYYGRISGKIAVKDYLNIDYYNFYIANGVFNQPIVCCGDKNNCQVSISHSESASASIAFDEKYPMGIDIEDICIKNSAVLEKYYTIREKLFCTNAIFTHIIWTAKEAVSKALKMGLTIPLHLLEVNSITESNDTYSVSFKNFSQFKVIGFLFRNNIISLAYPSSSRIDLSEFRTILSE